MRELVDTYKLHERLHVAISKVGNPISSQAKSQYRPLLELLEDLQAYMGWTVVQDAMREAREMQKMTQELLKEMD